MIAGVAHGGSFLRPAQTYPLKATFTPADAQSAASADGDAAVRDATHGIAVSSLRKLDTLKITSVADNPELRDLMATNWLQMQAAQSAFAREVSDDAPQNTYATVKV